MSVSQTLNRKGDMWRESSVSPDKRFHVLSGRSMYNSRFDEVMSFHEPGLAPARLGNEWFHIRPDGNRAYHRTFEKTHGFYCGLAAVNLQGEMFHILPNGQDAYEERFQWVGNFQEGLCSVRCRDGRYCHILPNGTYAYKPRWKYAGDFREGSSVVQDEDGMQLHIDPRGTPIYSSRFIDLLPFHKGIAPAKDERGWFHINNSGDALYERRFTSVEPFYNGQSRVQLADESIELIDVFGNTVQLLREGKKTALKELSDIMVSYWKSQVIHAAIELDVLEPLPATAQEVSSLALLPVDNVERLFRALWELGIVEKSQSLWIPTRTGKLLQREPKRSIKAVDWNWYELSHIGWRNLAESIKTGNSGTFISQGVSLFEFLRIKKNYMKNYQQAMLEYAKDDYESIPRMIDVNGTNEVADAGAGMGILLFNLLKAYPEIKGIIFDFPEVIKNVTVPGSLSSRVRKVGGSLFDEWSFSVPMIIMSRVLHDWDDDKALQILLRAKDALVRDGRILIVEMALDENSPFGGLADLNLLATCGGRERTMNQWIKLLSLAGLKIHSARKTGQYGMLIEIVRGE